jgi:NTP pyrophosphatase (non-canonical NTP hydrolase)
MAEAFDAWRKGRDDLGEELADVAIYLLSVAEMTGVELQDERSRPRWPRTQRASTTPCPTAFSPRATTTASLR